MAGILAALAALLRPWFVRLGLTVAGVAALNSEKTTEWLSEHGFKWLANAIHKITAWALDGIVVILKGVLYLFMDGILMAVKTFVGGIDSSVIALQWSTAYGLIPPQAAYFMTAIGFPQFVTMIAGAYTVRFLLNLIPASVTRA